MFFRLSFGVFWCFGLNVGKDFGRSAVVCVSHSVPKSFTLSLHDRLHAVEPSRGQEHRD